MTTGLDPSMTLGCGGYGGNVTSDNISPRHLLNIKRLAYETRNASQAAADLVAGAARGQDDAGDRAERPRGGLDASLVTARVARLLDEPRATPATDTPSAGPEPHSGATPPVPFVCEEDVRNAIRESPADRDRGTYHHHAGRTRPRGAAWRLLERRAGRVNPQDAAATTSIPRTRSRPMRSSCLRRSCVRCN